MVGATPNTVVPQLPNEDAVAIATDYFHSLDNVANEVEFLLKEIANKDEKVSELQTRLTQRTTTILTAARNITSSTSNNPSNTTSRTLNPLTPKDQQAYAKITAEWTKIDALQKEKTVLAERLVSIVTRHRERGREEYKKIVGEEAMEQIIKADKEMEITSPTGLANLISQYTGGIGMIMPSSAGGIGSGINSQRGSVGPSAAPANIGIDDRPTKKRKANGLSGNVTPSYHDMPPPSLPALHLPPGVGHTHASANVSSTLHSSNSSVPSYHQQIQLSARSTGSGRKGRQASETAEDVDMDTEEGRDDGGDDDTLYCFCQEKSYGEMIGCDNDSCRFEWFHLKCVKVEPPLPETWFCPECVAVLGYEDSNGKPKQKQKGRKK